MYFDNGRPNASINSVYGFDILVFGKNISG